MDDMYQKSITHYESLHMTKNQFNLAHVTNITKIQPNYIAKQPNLIA